MINKLTEIKMRHLFCILLVTVFSCKDVEKNNKQSKEEIKTINIDNEGFQKNRRKKEIEYIKRRNRNVEYFKNKEINDVIDREMNDSINALEKLLKNILVPTKANTINTAGKISTRTFFPELGFGMLDGLMSYNKDVSTLCTSSFIFSDYFKKQDYKIKKLSESGIVDIVSSAFASNYVITGIHSFKINEQENVQAYGLISIDGQDIGPFKPNTLYALVVIEDTIYLINKSIKQEMIGIEKCDGVWNNINGESEEEAWKSYCDCYKKEFVKHEQFVSLKEEIKEMVKLISD